MVFPACDTVLRAAHSVFALFLLLLPMGCTSGLEVSELLRIRDRGKLIVLTRNAPTTFYVSSERRMGFEHDLILAFARHLQVTPEFVVLDTEAEVYEALRQGKGDIAAAGLVQTEEGRQEFLFGPVYDQVQELVVCRRGNKVPNDLLQLNRVRLHIPEGSGQEVLLNELQQLIPDLSWDRTPELSTEQVLEKVWNSELECTVADSNIVRINQRYFPELEVSFAIEGGRQLSWVLPKRAHHLQQELKVWFRMIRDSGLMEEIRDRYYGITDFESFDYVDIRTFHQRMETRLPYFVRLFKKAEERYGIPWKMLAALSYQESHWNPWAKSPTGVRGVMMLTNLTAQELRITNRLDPRESVLGAAGYMGDLKRRLPPEVSEEDRNWLALAAYNVGMGHLMDGRELARRLGRNPNSWVELREVLPLLVLPEYHETLKYGYARGNEPVRFVQKVRLFLDILDKREDTIEPKENIALFRRAAKGLPPPSALWDDWQDVAGLGVLERSVQVNKSLLTKNRLTKAVAGGPPPVGEFGMADMEDVAANAEVMGEGDEVPPPSLSSDSLPRHGLK